MCIRDRPYPVPCHVPYRTYVRTVCAVLCAISVPHIAYWAHRQMAAYHALCQYRTWCVGRRQITYLDAFS
eukprot:1946774-Rhodomonas_salina.3